MNRRQRSTLMAYIYLIPYLSLFLLFIVTPLFFGLGLSFYDWEMLSLKPPEFIGTGNYQEALQDPYMRKALLVTLGFVVMSVPLTVSIALMMALGLSSIKHAQSFCRVSFMLPTMLNISVIGILWQWFYNAEFGMFNHYLQMLGVGKVPWLIDSRLAMPSIVLMTLWWTLGGPAIILLAGIKQIPEVFFEAAQIDGAGAWARFKYITLPGIRPVLLFVLVMNIIGSFQVFGQTYMLTRGGPELSTRVMVHYIYDTAFNFYRMGYGSALSWILFVIIAVFSVIQFFLLREKRV